MAPILDDDKTLGILPDTVDSIRPNHSTVGSKESLEEKRRKRESKGLLRTTKRKQKAKGKLNVQDRAKKGLIRETPPIDVNKRSLIGGVPQEKQFDLTKLDIKSKVPALTLKGPEIDAVTGPVKPPKEGWGMKTLDFLFGTEAAVLGIAHDSEGWSWSVENMKQQWSEQPLWVNLLGTASLVGTIAFPAVRALSMSAKFGKIATKTGKYGSQTDEIRKWKEMGRLDEKVTTFADLGDDADKTMTLLRKQDFALNKYSDMAKRADAIARGETTFSNNPTAILMHQWEKRFANKYADALNVFGDTSVKNMYHDNLDALWKSEEVGKLLTSLPGDASMPKIQAYMMGRLDTNLAPRAIKEFGKLNPVEKQFADFYYDAAKVNQKKMLDDGVISAAEYKKMGEIHLPAINKGTPMNVDEFRTHLVPVSKRNLMPTAGGLEDATVPATGVFAKLLGHKTKDVIKAVDETTYLPLNVVRKPRLDSPTLMSRKKTTAQAFESLKKGELVTAAHDMASNGYITDRLLHTNYSFIRDVAMNKQYTASAETIASWGGSAAKAADAGFVNIADAGSNAATRIQRMIQKKVGGEVEELPWIRKEIFDEVFGQHGMMAQTRWAGGDMMDVVTTIYKTMKTAGNIPTHLQNLTGNMVFLAQAGFNVTDPKNIELMGQMTGVFSKMAKMKEVGKKAGLDTSKILDPQSSVLKGVDLGSVKINGKTFNLNEEMFDPVIRELIEESAFEAVEGSGNLVNIAGRLKQNQYATKFAIDSYAKVKKLAQGGDRVKWFDGLTKAYLAEDMVPKMAYFMSLRGKGLSRQAAAVEVARRLPMYNSVGSSIKFGRKALFPWATFPVEALRITKNNMMDHPLRMMPWLRAPQIMQSMISGAGLAPDTREGVEAAEKMLPTWAQKNTTVVIEGDAGAAIGGGVTGGVVGATAGAILGGAKGAAAGGAIGAAFGGMLAAMTTDGEHEGQLRGALMDFLPHSTFSLANTSQDFGGQVVPFKDMQGLMEQMPAEPLAILKPFVDVMSGEDAYGNPVGDGTAWGGVAKGVAGFIGFVSPPIIQKYGFKTTTPDQPWPGDPTGVTNRTRLMVDTGQVVDPSTGLPGSFGHDFLLNNFSAWKSYAATGEQQLTNESLTERNLQEVRSHLTKNLSYHLQNGHDDDVVEILSSIQGSFANQYLHDPRMANAKYYEWLERHQKALGRHPKLRNWSEEELTSRLRLAKHAAGEARSAARNTLLEALRDEMRVRGMGGGGGSSGGGLQNNPMKGGLKGGLGS